MSPRENSSDPFAQIRKRARKPYGRCAGCGAKTATDGAAVVRAQVVKRRRKGDPDENVVSQNATMCADCGVRWWRAVEAAFGEVGVDLR